MLRWHRLALVLSFACLFSCRFAAEPVVTTVFGMLSSPTVDGAGNLFVVSGRSTIQRYRRTSTGRVLLDHQWTIPDVEILAMDATADANEVWVHLRTTDEFGWHYVTRYELLTNPDRVESTGYVSLRDIQDETITDLAAGVRFGVNGSLYDTDIVYLVAEHDTRGPGVLRCEVSSGCRSSQWENHTADGRRRLDRPTHVEVDFATGDVYVVEHHRAREDARTYAYLWRYAGTDRLDLTGAPPVRLDSGADVAALENIVVARDGIGRSGLNLALFENPSRRLDQEDAALIRRDTRRNPLLSLGLAAGAKLEAPAHCGYMYELTRDPNGLRGITRIEQHFIGNCD